MSFNSTFRFWDEKVSVLYKKPAELLYSFSRFFIWVIQILQDDSLILF